MSKTVRKERDYGKGFIYKLRCLDPEIKNIYVGSSTNKSQRKKTHKTGCTDPKRKDYNLPVYQFIRAHGGWDNWEMVVIKLFPCASKMELEIEEENVRVELEEFSTLNRHKAWAGVEYGLPRKEYGKKYREKNKDEITEKKNKKITCGCGSTIRKDEKARHEKSLKHQKWLESK
jgi:hypothetical protein